MCNNTLSHRFKGKFHQKEIESNLFVKVLDHPFFIGEIEAYADREDMDKCN